MKNMNIIIKYSFALLIAGLCYSCFFAAGSYPYAEQYEINISFDELILRIQEFKMKETQYKVFQINEKGKLYEPGGYIQNQIGETAKTTLEPNDSSIWYSCYFYFSDIKASVHCVINIRGDNSVKETTVLKLSAVTYSPNFGEWKRINTKDLSKDENILIKEKFETEVLNKLGQWERCK